LSKGLHRFRAHPKYSPLLLRLRLQRGVALTAQGGVAVWKLGAMLRCRLQMNILSVGAAVPAYGSTMLSLTSAACSPNICTRDNLCRPCAQETEAAQVAVIAFPSLWGLHTARLLRRLRPDVHLASRLAEMCANRRISVSTSGNALIEGQSSLNHPLPLLPRFGLRHRAGAVASCLPRRSAG
jgi:hypothetical protein